MKRLVLLLVCLFFIALAGALYWRAFSNKTAVEKNIDLSEKRTITAKEPTEETLKIAVSAMISPKETLKVYGDIVAYIGEKMGKRVEMVQRKTYDEVNELVKNQEVVAAFVCAGPYVNGHDDFGMEIVAVPEMYGKTVYYSYIIAPENSSAKNLADLEGKKFAFTDPKSNTGKLVPTYALSKMGETPDSFFEKYIFTGSHDSSIEAVAKKIVDGAAVDHLIYDYIKATNPDFVAGTKVVDSYGPFGIPPFVTNPNVDEKIKKQLKEILLNMDRDPAGKALIDKIKIDRFIEGRDADYASVREMESWINATK